MKKNTPALPPTRPLYALLLVAVALLLWLLARPQPGLRVTRLQPILAPEPGAPAARVPDRLRVATYNLENFTDGRNDGPERTPAVFMTHARDAAALIAEADPDILLLEEIENGRVLEYLNDQLTNAYPYIYISKLRHSSGAKEKLNLALFSRLPPSRVRQLSFHNLVGAGHPTRGSLAAEFDLGDGSTLLVYGIHLKSNFGDAPKNQAQRGIALCHIAADAISENLQNLPRPTSIVILGDTNVDPDCPAFADDPSLYPLAGAFDDLWRGRPIAERTTIPTRLAGETGDPLMVFPPSAFDRVFVSHNLTAAGPWKALPPQSLQKGTDTTNNLTQPGFNGHVSDHHLVYVDLTR
jgi:endonuclease/exonuclease/phosphatase family metal-dependent hydrolase